MRPRTSGSHPGYLHRLAGLFALAALLLPIAAGAAGVDLAGWRPDHGHLSANGAVPPHAHPYDHETEHSRDAAPQDSLDESRLIFTYSAQAHGSVSTILPAAVAVMAIPSPDGSIAVMISPGGEAPPDDAFAAVPTPPPRA